MDPESSQAGSAVISVSQFLDIINETLVFAFPQVVIEGEVSSFKISQGKFIFFDLKDETGVLNCFMMVYQLKLPIEDGMKVRVTGSPKVMGRSSKFSLTVRGVELAGEGDLKRSMELLRRKLEAEGLFAAERKRPLPAFPRRIGLITSGTSAAYADFVKILAARWGGVEVKLADVSVQGAAAPDQVVAALEYFNTAAEPVDVVAVIRGGGSLEDLSAFSTEPVARAVAASRAPVVVGVGHEIDVSLADYAADVRAATPTDAARLIVPDRGEIAARVAGLTGRAEGALRRALAQRLAAVDSRLNSLERYLRRPLEQVSDLRRRLAAGAGNLAAGRAARVESLRRALRAYNPRAVLERGYAIVRGPDGRVLRDAAVTRLGDPLIIQLAAGELTATITKEN